MPEIADHSAAAQTPGAQVPAGQALFEGLQAIEARCIRSAARLPHGEPSARIWTMVVFRLAGRTLLTPLEQVAEVLTVPAEITRVPGTKPWVMGVANNRGTLLPIYDLDECLSGTPTRRTDQERVLVVRQEELPFGILVGGPVGIHHCQASMAVNPSPAAFGPMAPLIEGGFLRESEHLPVANLARLAALPQFASAAA
jgi:twitching motility protein PilI